MSIFCRVVLTNVYNSSEHWLLVSRILECDGSFKANTGFIGVGCVFKIYVGNLDAVLIKFNLMYKLNSGQLEIFPRWMPTRWDVFQDTKRNKRSYMPWCVQCLCWGTIKLLEENNAKWKSKGQCYQINDLRLVGAWDLHNYHLLW